jgi:hypothetical protein
MSPCAIARHDRQPAELEVRIVQLFDQLVPNMLRVARSGPHVSPMRLVRLLSGSPFGVGFLTVITSVRSGAGFAENSADNWLTIGSG